LLLINIIDDWYITANSFNFIVGRWDCKSYEPKKNKTALNTKRNPLLHDRVDFDNLYDCFNFIYKTYQLQAFQEAENGKELFEILTNLNKSMEIIRNAVSGSFLKLQKEERRKKRSKD